MREIGRCLQRQRDTVASDVARYAEPDTAPETAGLQVIPDPRYVPIEDGAEHERAMTSEASPKPANDGLSQFMLV